MKIRNGYSESPEPAQQFQPPPSPSATNLNEQPSNDDPTGNAVSIAESYPAEEDAPVDTELHQENEVLFEPNPTISYEPLPQKSDAAPASNPVVPEQPPKIAVEIENSEEEDPIAPIVNTNRQQPSQGNWPLNNFFPISFGSTSGGAIAIANSFSTGKGGTAASRATAYGSSKAKLKKQP